MSKQILTRERVAVSSLLHTMTIKEFIRMTFNIHFE
jgi:hypothetical protein